MKKVLVVFLVMGMLTTMMAGAALAKPFNSGVIFMETVRKAK